MSAAEVLGGDHPLAKQCLDICRPLASQDRKFTFNLKLSPFSFSLETRGKETPTTSVVRKKLSPSAMRRNEKRKQMFLKKKQLNPSEQEVDKAEVSENEAEQVVSETTKDRSESKGRWNSEVVEHGSKSVKLKFKKVNSKIPQFDGQNDEETTDAEVQTDYNPEVKTTETQTTKSPPELGYWSMNWSTFTAPVSARVSATELPIPTITNNMVPYRPPHHR